MSSKSKGFAKNNNDQDKDAQQALKLIHQGKLKEAEFIYRKLIQEGVRNEIIFSNLAAICGTQGKKQEMAELLNEALSIKPNYPEALSNLGYVLQEQGDLEGAIASYRKALSIKPNYPDALYNLGYILQEQGDLEGAIASYRKALSIKPNYPEALYNLGIALKRQGDLEGAIASCRKALSIKPNYPEALSNLGNALQKQGDLEAAIISYRKALFIKPNYPEVLNNLGGALQEQRDLEGAIVSCRKALSIKPNYPEALSNLGCILQEQGDLEGAIASCRKALSIKPNYPEALSNLGCILQEQGDLEGAIASCRKALSIKPNYSEALSNLGCILQEQGDLEGAIASCRKALSIKPNYPEALSNLGCILQEQGDLEGAIASFRKALSINPHHPDIHFNLSCILLLSGDYDNGWKDYEWRLNKTEAMKTHAHLQVEQWNGHNHSSGEKLILVSEQGLGDTLQFMRYVPYLRSMSMDVSLCAPPKLHSLIQSSGITTTLYTPEEANTITTGKWLPLLSLPGYLNVRPDNPLVDTPYIKVPKQKILEWKQKLAAEKRPIIGINWQGNPQIEKTNLAGRSLPLSAFAPIIETTRVSLLSLQKGFGSEQLMDCSFLHRFVDCQGEISQIWDFVETAAIILNCDLIITSDTVVAHLAGGLGKPTWLLLKNIPDWRWGIAGETSFWYPSMRLFRQRERSNWSEVMQRVATALESFASSRIDAPAPARKSISISIPVSLAELLDKITILEIKSEQFHGEQKRNVDHELSLLKHVLRQSGVELLPEQHQQLKTVNQSLWQIEESIREHERRKDFGEEFIILARSVYLENDKRAEIKRTINNNYDSAIKEEKSYG